MDTNSKISQVCVPNKTEVSSKKNHFTSVLNGFEVFFHDKKKKYFDKCQSLAIVWEQVAVLVSTPATASTSPQPEFESLFIYTLRLVLRADWGRVSPAIQTHLTVTLQRCISGLEYSKHHPSILIKCRLLESLVKEPWEQPTLKKILEYVEPKKTEDGEPEVNQPKVDEFAIPEPKPGEPHIEELLEYFKLENGQVIVIRLEMLLEAHCEDLAGNLSKWCLISYHNSHPLELDFNQDELDYILDIYYCTLSREKDQDRLIDEMKVVELDEGLHLLMRYSRNGGVGRGFNDYCKDCRIWKSRHSKNIMTTLGNTLVANATLHDDLIESDIVLPDLIKEWASLFKCSKTGDFDSIALKMINKLVLSAGSSKCIYPFCSFLVENLARKEIHLNFITKCLIRAINQNMNEIEQHRVSREYYELKRTYEHLSQGFVLISKLLSDYENIRRECLLTAFSLTPSREGLEQLEELVDQPVTEPTEGCSTVAVDIEGASNTVESASENLGSVPENVSNPETINVNEENVVEAVSSQIITNESNLSSDEHGKSSSDSISEANCPKNQEGNQGVVSEELVSGSTLNVVSAFGYKRNLLSMETDTRLKSGGAVEEIVRAAAPAYCLEVERLELEESVKMDLSSILRYQRFRSLSWELDSNELKANCEKFLEAFEKRGFEEVELKYLDLDYSQFKDKPINEDDYIGIEKGYEHFAEPNWDEQDYDLINSSQSRSSDDTDGGHTSRRKVGRRGKSKPKKKSKFTADGSSEEFIGRTNKRKRESSVSNVTLSRAKKLKTVLSNGTDMNIDSQSENCPPEDMSGLSCNEDSTEVPNVNSLQTLREFRMKTPNGGELSEIASNSAKLNSSFRMSPVKIVIPKCDSVFGRSVIEEENQNMQKDNFCSVPNNEARLPITDENYGQEAVTNSRRPSDAESLLNFVTTLEVRLTRISCSEEDLMEVEDEELETPASRELNAELRSLLDLFDSNPETVQRDAPPPTPTPPPPSFTPPPPPPVENYEIAPESNSYYENRLLNVMSDLQSKPFVMVHKRQKKDDSSNTKPRAEKQERESLEKTPRKKESREPTLRKPRVKKTSTEPIVKRPRGRPRKYPNCLPSNVSNTSQLPPVENPLPRMEPAPQPASDQCLNPYLFNSSYLVPTSFNPLSYNGLPAPAIPNCPPDFVNVQNFPNDNVSMDLMSVNLNNYATNVPANWHQDYNTLPPYSCVPQTYEQTNSFAYANSYAVPAVNFVSTPAYIEPEHSSVMGNCMTSGVNMMNVSAPQSVSEPPVVPSDSTLNVLPPPPPPVTYLSPVASVNTFDAPQSIVQSSSRKSNHFEGNIEAVEQTSGVYKEIIHKFPDSQHTLGFRKKTVNGMKRPRNMKKDIAVSDQSSAYSIPFVNSESVEQPVPEQQIKGKRGRKPKKAAVTSEPGLTSTTSMISFQGFDDGSLVPRYNGIELPTVSSGLPLPEPENNVNQQCKTKMNKLTISLLGSNLTPEAMFDPTPVFFTPKASTEADENMQFRRENEVEQLEVNVGTETANGYELQNRIEETEMSSEPKVQSKSQNSKRVRKARKSKKKEPIVSKDDDAEEKVTCDESYSVGRSKNSEFRTSSSSPKTTEGTTESEKDNKKTPPARTPPRNVTVSSSSKIDSSLNITTEPTRRRRVKRPVKRNAEDSSENNLPAEASCGQTHSVSNLKTNSSPRGLSRSPSPNVAKRRRISKVKDTNAVSDDASPSRRESVRLNGVGKFDSLKQDGCDISLDDSSLKELSPERPSIHSNDQIVSETNIPPTVAVNQEVGSPAKHEEEIIDVPSPVPSIVLRSPQMSDTSPDSPKSTGSNRVLRPRKPKTENANYFSGRWSSASSSSSYSRKSSRRKKVRSPRKVNEINVDISGGKSPTGSVSGDGPQMSFIPGDLTNSSEQMKVGSPARSNENNIDVLSRNASPVHEFFSASSGPDTPEMSPLSINSPEHPLDYGVESPRSSTQENKDAHSGGASPSSSISNLSFDHFSLEMSSTPPDSPKSCGSDRVLRPRKSKIVYTDYLLGPRSPGSTSSSYSRKSPRRKGVRSPRKSNKVNVDIWVDSILKNTLATDGPETSSTPADPINSKQMEVGCSPNSNGCNIDVLSQDVSPTRESYDPSFESDSRATAMDSQEATRENGVESPQSFTLVDLNPLFGGGSPTSTFSNLSFDRFSLETSSTPPDSPKSWGSDRVLRPRKPKIGNTFDFSGPCSPASTSSSHSRKSPRRKAVRSPRKSDEVNGDILCSNSGSTPAPDDPAMKANRSKTGPSSNRAKRSRKPKKEDTHPLPVESAASSAWNPRVVLRNLFPDPSMFPKVINCLKPVCKVTKIKISTDRAPKQTSVDYSQFNLRPIRVQLPRLEVIPHVKHVCDDEVCSTKVSPSQTANDVESQKNSNCASVKTTVELVTQSTSVPELSPSQTANDVESLKNSNCASVKTTGEPVSQSTSVPEFHGTVNGVKRTRKYKKKEKTVSPITVTKCTTDLVGLEGTNSDIVSVVPRRRKSTKRKNIHSDLLDDNQCSAAVKKPNRSRKSKTNAAVPIINASTPKTLAEGYSIIAVPDISNIPSAEPAYQHHFLYELDSRVIEYDEHIEILTGYESYLSDNSTDQQASDCGENNVSLLNEMEEVTVVRDSEDPISVEYVEETIENEHSDISYNENAMYVEEISDQEEVLSCSESTMYVDQSLEREDAVVSGNATPISVKDFEQSIVSEIEVMKCNEDPIIRAKAFQNMVDNIAIYTGTTSPTSIAQNSLTTEYVEDLNSDTKGEAMLSSFVDSAIEYVEDLNSNTKGDVTSISEDAFAETISDDYATFSQDTEMQYCEDLNSDTMGVAISIPEDAYDGAMSTDFSMFIQNTTNYDSFLTCEQNISSPSSNVELVDDELARFFPGVTFSCSTVSSLESLRCELRKIIVSHYTVVESLN